MQLFTLTRNIYSMYLEIILPIMWYTLSRTLATWFLLCRICRVQKLISRTNTCQTTWMKGNKSQMYKKLFKSKVLRCLLLDKWTCNPIFTVFTVLYGYNVHTRYNISFSIMKTTIKSQLFLIPFGSWRILIRLRPA